jgi:hypothetical protein
MSISSLEAAVSLGGMPSIGDTQSKGPGGAGMPSLGGAKSPESTGAGATSTGPSVDNPIHGGLTFVAKLFADFDFQQMLHVIIIDLIVFALLYFITWRFLNPT